MEITVIKKNNDKIDRSTGKPIERLRVVAYARVSTDTEEQKNSYESQKQYYKEKILSNSSWSFEGIYADEGISGTQDYKRENFMAMIDDGLQNKFDVILTKSISRFARNTVDTLKYVRMFKEKNIAIIFEEEGINTLEMAGELLLAVLSSVAQQESETISSHVKLGFKMKSERGELVGFNNCFGFNYDSKTNTMTIVEEEASVVKFIFKKYLEGYGCDAIANIVNEMGYKTKRNNKWSASSILGMLKNEKYVGDVIQGKTFTTDPITHKRLANFGESEKWYMKDHHQAIISREDFEEVANIIKARRGVRACGRKTNCDGYYYTFSGKIKCGFCGTSYSRRTMYSKGSTVVIWDCILNIEGGKNQCPNSKAVRETLVEKAFVDAYNLLCNAKDLNIEELLNTIAKAMMDDSLVEKKQKLQKNKNNLEMQNKKILDLLINEIINEDTYRTKKQDIDDKLDKLEHKLLQYEVIDGEKTKIENGIEKIRKEINVSKILSEFDSEVFNALIDYVIIGGYDNGQIDKNMIRFICRSDFNKTGDTLTSDDFIRNKNIIDGESEDFIPILDFYSNQTFYVFERDETGKLRKILVPKVRVRLELAK